uniref:Ig-like domain-containing protein n=1 Tax=Trichogramma kaykai TaxID=54128 RepID=A0ABD2W4Z4_9HYME
MDRSDWFKLTFIVIVVTGVECLKNVKLEVSPQAVEQGHEATLRCHYELEEAPLYSLKYYRGSYEFYRYSPNERPQTKIFNFTWIEVDSNKSDERQVTIKNVDFLLSGNFSCEVTTDAPTFSTATSTKILTVVSIPKGKPVILSERRRYKPGDTLRANCSMPSSKPQAQIFFTLNDDVINDAYVRPLTFDTKREKSKKKHSSSVTSSSSRSSTIDEPHQQQLQPRQTSDRQGIQLIMQLQTFHYVSGQLNLRCVVRIADVYEQWSELQLGSNLREPIPERVRSENVCNQCHTITNSIIFGLMLLILYTR